MQFTAYCDPVFDGIFTKTLRKIRATPDVRDCLRSSAGKTIFLAMKLTAIILLTCCLGASAHGYSQKITLSEKNPPLTKVLHEIEKQSGYQFLFFDNDIKLAKPVSIETRN